MLSDRDNWLAYGRTTYRTTSLPAAPNFKLTSPEMAKGRVKIWTRGMGACHGKERKRTSIQARRRSASFEIGTRRAAIEFDEFLEFFALALNYLSPPRALAAANTSKLSCGAAGALESSDKPKGSGSSAEARTFRCETHRALADARRARARRRTCL